ncbi:Riorf59 protein [hydrothermal vent metagenome]|uniref:Riorf59 protein n=1 Tax=hydrothermal vent metagenome TaxID=652676 RepID=A0A3B0URB6_9ZZZZ
MQSHSATKLNQPPNILLAQEKPVFEIVNAKGAAPVIFVCEHASNRIPQYFGDLGLSQQELQSHIAWDPGARQIALALSTAFDAPLISSSVSRLIYDCNRPPDSANAMRTKSENTLIPGNTNISEAEAHARIEQIYLPFVSKLQSVIKQKSDTATLPVMITIHSFTPVYFGKPRDVEIGVLHSDDGRLADAMLALNSAHTALNVKRNKPYGPLDGVTHTLKEHGLKNGLINVMLEIRNDLIAAPKDQQAMALMLTRWLKDALARLDVSLQISEPDDLTAKKE